MQHLNYKHFNIAAAVSFIAAGIIMACSFIYGKDNFFLLLNTNLGSFADHFFAAFTYGGDAIIWLVVLLTVLYMLKRKEVVPLIISSFIAVTVLTQICKYIIVPDEPRPIKAIADIAQIHTVAGVEMYTVSSFPSGHTATAFCFYLIFCLLINKPWWLIAGFIYALLVGYSRVYLAQHFPLDVGAGMIVGIISVFAAAWFQQYWWKRKA